MTAQKTSLFNAFETQLSASVGAADLTFNVDATAPLTSPCYLVIDPTSASKREYVLFDGAFTSTAFVTTTTANRGLGGSAAGAQSHAAGTTVRCVPMHQHFGDLNDRVDTRAIAAYLPHNVMEAPFSAVGDGIADDTAAVQSAIDAAEAAGGGVVFFPNGRYRTTGITVDAPGIALRGESTGDGGVTGYGSQLIGGITLAATGDYFEMSDLYYQGRLSVTGSGPVTYVYLRRVLLRNPSPSFDWNVYVDIPTTEDVLQHLHAESCMFEQGGVYLNFANTATFIRCRFANSRQDAALYIDQDGTFTGAESNVQVLSSVLEGNNRRAIYAGRNTGLLVVRDCYLESNNQDAAVDIGDIEIASLDTANDGGMQFQGNVHTGSSSNYAVKFPAAPTRTPRMLMMLNRFHGVPAAGGALIQNPPLGLIAIGNYYSTAAFSGGAGPTLRLVDGGTGAGDAGSTTRDYIELRDVSLYRSAANTWRTDDGMRVGGTFEAENADNYLGPTTNRLNAGSLSTADVWLDAVGGNADISLRLRAKGTGVIFAQSKIRALADVEIDGALDHDGTAVGFYGVAPVTRPTSLTASDASVVDATYGVEEEAVIKNLRTRVNELESKLQSLGLLT